MPTYEYQCQKCRGVQEVEHSMKEDPWQVQLTLTCPNGCVFEGWESGYYFKRLVSGSAFSLQGGGWSRDGYR